MSEATALDPLPILLLRRGQVAARQIGVLQEDPRVELFPVSELTPEWIAFAQRATAVLVATSGDPFDPLTYVVTAGVSAPIVFAVRPEYRADIPDVLAAGAELCLTMPIRTPDVDTLVKTLVTHAAPARVDGTLRLLLDPIARNARYQDRSVRLSPREFALLHCLSGRGGRPVAADELLRYVWGEQRSEQSRQIIEVYIFALRRKLDRLGLHGAISTVRGFGYALVQVTSQAAAR